MAKILDNAWQLGGNCKEKCRLKRVVLKCDVRNSHSKLPQSLQTSLIDAISKMSECWKDHLLRRGGIWKSHFHYIWEWFLLRLKSLCSSLLEGFGTISPAAGASWGILATTLNSRLWRMESNPKKTYNFGEVHLRLAAWWRQPGKRTIFKLVIL